MFAMFVEACGVDEAMTVEDCVRDASLSLKDMIGRRPLSHHVALDGGRDAHDPSRREQKRG